MCFNHNAMQYAWHSKLAGSKKLLLLALADHVDENGICFPGVKRLAEKCSMSKRQVQNLLRQLVEAGELFIEQQAGIKTTSGKTNRYHLIGYLKSVGKVAAIQSKETKSPVSNTPENSEPVKIIPSLEEQGMNAITSHDVKSDAQGMKHTTSLDNQGMNATSPVIDEGVKPSTPQGVKSSSSKNTEEHTDKNIKDIPTGKADALAPVDNSEKLNSLPSAQNTFEEQLRATIFARTKPTERKNIDFEKKATRSYNLNYETLFSGRAKKGKWAEFKIDDPPMTAVEIIGFGIWCGIRWQNACDNRSTEALWDWFMPKKAESIAEKVLEFRADTTYDDCIASAKSRYWQQVMGETIKEEIEIDTTQITDFRLLEMAVDGLIASFEGAN